MDRRIVAPLAEHGHELTYVADVLPSATDDDVLELANNTKAILITEDKDFGDLVIGQERISQGVVLIRLSGLRHESKANMLRSVIEQHADELLGSMIIVAPGGIRIRRLQQ